MNKTKTPEQMTADTILQHELIITAGPLRYKVKPPTAATLIEASAAISHLPKVKYNEENGKVMIEVLREAKGMRSITIPLAIIIVGAQAPTWNIAARRYHRKKLHRVANELLYNLTSEQLFQLASQLFASLNVSDFFALTAFLSEVNVTKPTKAEKTTTPSGAQ